MSSMSGGSQPLCSCCDSGGFVPEVDNRHLSQGVGAAQCQSCKHTAISHRKTEHIPYPTVRPAQPSRPALPQETGVYREQKQQRYDTTQPEHAYHQRPGGERTPSVMPIPGVQPTSVFPGSDPAHPPGSGRPSYDRPNEGQRQGAPLPLGTSNGIEQNQQQHHVVEAGFTPRQRVESMYRTPEQHTSTQSRRERAKALVTLMDADERYKTVDMDQLMEANRETHHQQYGTIMADGMDVLERYAFNLLRETRPDGWRTIRCSNTVYKTRILPMVGAQVFLNILGYTQVTEQELSFPPDTIPNRAVVVELAADMILAYAEIELRMQGLWSDVDTLMSGQPLSQPGHQQQQQLNQAAAPGRGVMDSAQFQRGAYLGTDRKAAPQPTLDPPLQRHQQPFQQQYQHHQQQALRQQPVQQQPLQQQPLQYQPLHEQPLQQQPPQQHPLQQQPPQQQPLQQQEQPMQKPYPFGFVQPPAATNAGEAHMPEALHPLPATRQDSHLPNFEVQKPIPQGDVHPERFRNHQSDLSSSGPQQTGADSRQGTAHYQERSEPKALHAHPPAPDRQDQDRYQLPPLDIQSNQQMHQQQQSGAEQHLPRQPQHSNQQHMSSDPLHENSSLPPGVPGQAGNMASSAASSSGQELLSQQSSPYQHLPGAIGSQNHPLGASGRMQLPKIDLQKSAIGSGDNQTVSLITPDVIGVVGSGEAFPQTTAPKQVPVAAASEVAAEYGTTPRSGESVHRRSSGSFPQTPTTPATPASRTSSRPTSSSSDRQMWSAQQQQRQHSSDSSSSPAAVTTPQGGFQSTQRPMSGQQPQQRQYAGQHSGVMPATPPQRYSSRDSGPQHPHQYSGQQSYSSGEYPYPPRTNMSGPHSAQLPGGIQAQQSAGTEHGHQSGGHHSSGHQSSGHHSGPRNHSDQHSGYQSSHHSGPIHHSGQHQPHSGQHQPHSGQHQPHSGQHQHHSGQHQRHSGQHQPHSGQHQPHSGPHHYSGQLQHVEPQPQRVSGPQQHYQEGATNIPGAVPSGAGLTSTGASPSGPQAAAVHQPFPGPDQNNLNIASASRDGAYAGQPDGYSQDAGPHSTPHSGEHRRFAPGQTLNEPKHVTTPRSASGSKRRPPPPLGTARPLTVEGLNQGAAGSLKPDSSSSLNQSIVLPASRQDPGVIGAAVTPSQMAAGVDLSTPGASASRPHSRSSGRAEPVQCAMCHENEATFMCSKCPLSPLCERCDEIMHKPRPDHRRQRISRPGSTPSQGSTPPQRPDAAGPPQSNSATSSSPYAEPNQRLQQTVGSRLSTLREAISPQSSLGTAAAPAETSAATGNADNSQQAFVARTEPARKSQAQALLKQEAKLEYEEHMRERERQATFSNLDQARASSNERQTLQDTSSGSDADVFVSAPSSPQSGVPSTSESPRPNPTPRPRAGSKPSSQTPPKPVPQARPRKKAPSLPPQEPLQPQKPSQQPNQPSQQPNQQPSQQLTAELQRPDVLQNLNRNDQATQSQKPVSNQQPSFQQTQPLQPPEQQPPQHRSQAQLHRPVQHQPNQHPRTLDMTFEVVQKSQNDQDNVTRAPANGQMEVPKAVNGQAEVPQRPIGRTQASTKPSGQDELAREPHSTTGTGPSDCGAAAQGTGNAPAYTVETLASPEPNQPTIDRLKVEKERTDGMQFILWMKEIERVGTFTPEDLNNAYTFLLQCAYDDNGVHNKSLDIPNPVQWLYGRGFAEHCQLVCRRAVEISPIVHTISKQEAQHYLRLNEMSAVRAALVVVKERQKNAAAICEELSVQIEVAHQALWEADGDVEAAHRGIVRHHLLANHLDRLWHQTDVGCRVFTGESGESRKYPEVIQEKGAEKQHRIRCIMSEVVGLGNVNKAELAILIHDEGLSDDVIDVVEAARQTNCIAEAQRFLKVECQICFTDHPHRRILSTGYCECHVCSDCLREYYKVCILEYNLIRFVCPVCLMPNVLQMAEDVTYLQDYLGCLDIFLRNLLPIDQHDLFHKKLADFTMHRSSDFRWCPHCNNGFVNEIPDRFCVACPTCRESSCFKCKVKWEEQHQSKSCEQFHRWKTENDEEYQQKGLAAHLAEHGITCPSCHFRYEMSRGACMHFTCSQCKHEFCSGCNNPFMRGEECGRPNHKAMGFHCHCPRDCLSRLRDCDVAHLQDILKKSGVEYRTQPTEAQIRQAQESAGDDGAQVKCSISEQKQDGTRLFDELCGRDAVNDHAGLCEKHYKEYLVHVINSHALDPAPFMTIGELSIVIRQNELAEETPKRTDDVTEDQHRELLLQFVQDRIRLTREKSVSAFDAGDDGGSADESDSGNDAGDSADGESGEEAMEEA
ncbi:transcription factor 20-like isoform X2 [Sycon ciliatum]|uniref:transcription factor 20-like isoform X2 n=1 Tax=Sycon ciliatum TaxID=27933 RepID=UPI0031F6B7D3